ncbi:glycosyl hydrolase family 26 [Glaciihabitans tibetensis]|uniref:Glycosyl hydrolase family 26 n=2 Tax=Glaciihabitans tibetensis TaxID=1266600 RepID=A0A2T0VEI5_9MICO|nr:glycosyl hydrolase family 26 [Glaciihabitans tibetensis]
MTVAALVSVVPITACSATDPSTPDDAAACTVVSAAEVIPESGALLGVNLDWSAESLQDYSARLRLRPAVAVSFADLPLSDDDLVNVAAAVDQVRSINGTLLLTLEPSAGLAAVTAEAADELAGQLARYNESGVPVIVRFAHEMNGSWYAWGQQPTAYVAAFRDVASALRQAAPGSSMMWAPNYAGGYPFAGGEYQATPGTADFIALDTNGDGVLTIADDPYAPYYPGDDVVDWVGMSLYHWGSVHPWGENEVPESGKFAAQLAGEYNGLGGDDTAAPNFYQTYGVEHGKPVAIPETAALVIPNGDAALELSIKQAWWQQVFSDEIATQFPQLHMINWFEWNKFESEVGANVDWTIAGSDTVREAFSSDIPSWAITARSGTPCAAPPATDEG